MAADWGRIWRLRQRPPASQDVAAAEDDDERLAPAPAAPTSVTAALLGQRAAPAAVAPVDAPQYGAFSRPCGVRIGPHSVNGACCIVSVCRIRIARGVVPSQQLLATAGELPASFSSPHGATPGGRAVPAAPAETPLVISSTDATTSTSNPFSVYGTSAAPRTSR